mgnify:CR=1 FL=1
MKRLLVVGRDRAFTRFVAESLIGRPMDAFMPRPDDPWDVARAHSALEADVLVTRGRRRFDVVVLDRELPDRAPLELAERLRRTPRAQATPIFLVTERGRDPHARRIATERLGIAGFLERPVSASTLNAGLELLERRRRVLVVEPEPERGLRFARAFERHDFDVMTASSREGAMRAMRNFDPDVAALSLSCDVHGGLDVCAELERARADRRIPVALYGQPRALPRQERSENALRADDFVRAPFDDDFLVQRIIGLVGLGGNASDPAASDSADDSGDQSSDLPTSPGKVPSSGFSELSAPPPSASPAAVGPTQRQTRRVPCETKVRIRDGETLVESRTLDISHGGLYFQLDRPPSVGTRLDLAFRLPETEQTIRAEGKVAWLGPRGVGVKFSRIDKADLHAIVDYVNRVSRVLYSPG